MSGVKSINEPATAREVMLTPQSINEPMAPPERPPPEVDPPAQAPAKLETKASGLVDDSGDYLDPDELEEEIEEAGEEGDFQPMHRGPKRGKAKR